MLCPIMVGTGRYSSIRTLRGYEQSRRDDLEALGYIFMYLLRGSLPWIGVTGRHTKDRNTKIAKMKSKLTPVLLCQNMQELDLYGTVEAAIGIIDSINIGDLTFHDALTTIIDNNDCTGDNLQQYDIIIGLDFLKLCGEARFMPREAKIIFPATPTQLPGTGRNLLLSESDNLRLEAYVNGERCHFFFDTGNSITAFSKQYYERHKAEIDKTARKVTREGGGIGRNGMLTTLKLPPVTMTTGGSDVELEHVAVVLEGLAPVQIDDGNVGVNLIQDCRMATLNLKDLFLKIED